MTSRFKPLKSYLHIRTEFATIQAQMQQNKAILDQVRAELPHQLRDHCLSAVTRNGHIVLYADSSAWASRLRYFSQELTNRLQKKCIEVNKLSIKVTPDSLKIKRDKNPRSARHLSEENSQLLSSVAEHTDDPGLQAALRRLSSHCKNGS